jgi:hypothetical protein
MAIHIRRREFIFTLGGAAAAWPLAARAQRSEPIRRVVVLMGAAETSWSRGWLAALLRRLDELGWRDGRNLVTQVQWWNDQPEQMRAWAAELIARSPDVAVTFTNLALEVLKPIAEGVPIVFVGVGNILRKCEAERVIGTLARLAQEQEPGMCGSTREAEEDWGRPNTPRRHSRRARPEFVEHDVSQPWHATVLPGARRRRHARGRGEPVRQHPPRRRRLPGAAQPRGGRACDVMAPLPLTIRFTTIVPSPAGGEETRQGELGNERGVERSADPALLCRVGFVCEALVQAFGTRQVGAQLRRDEQVVKHEASAVMEHREALRFWKFRFRPETAHGSRPRHCRRLRVPPAGSAAAPHRRPH